MNDLNIPVRHIGLLADSHGDLQATSRSIKLLNRNGADFLVHLGDFFDSSRNYSHKAITGLLQEHNVHVVKGNNELQVENTLSAELACVNSEVKEVLQYLKALPLVIVFEDLCFAHSLPFDNVRSVYEPIDTGGTERARVIFQNTAHRVLFCGHSHLPIIFEWNSDLVRRIKMDPGSSLRLSADSRYIIVIGAAESGECSLFDLKSMIYKRFNAV